MHKLNISFLKFLLFVYCAVSSNIIYAQSTVTIGSETLNDKAVLMLVAPGGDQGLILPVVNGKEAVNPTADEKGLVVYDLSDDKIYYWNGTGWIDLVGSGSVNLNSINELEDVDGSGASTGQVLKWNGNSWVPASDETGGSGSSSDDQHLTFDETTRILSIENGNTVDLSTLISAVDADADPTNELQDISLSGTNLSISDGATIDLAPIIPPGGTDDQIAIEVPYDNTNSGLSASDAQAAIDELAANGTVDTDDQELILTGDVLTIEDGTGSVDLSTYVDDADADPTNEVDVTTQTGLIIGNGTDLTGLIGTADGQVAKWDDGAGAWVAGIDESGGGDLWTDNNNDIYYDGGNVGIGITETPKGALQVKGGEIVLFGDDTFGDGAKLMWLPELGAFRVGRLSHPINTSTFWDRDSIGSYSFASGRDTRATGSGATAMGYFTQAIGQSSIALGRGTIATGIFSTAMGDQTRAVADRSTAMGYLTRATGTYSTAMGFRTQAVGLNSTAMGLQTRAVGSNSTAMGLETRAQSHSSIAVGRHNVGGGNPTQWVGNDPIFEIGIGTISNPANAVTVLKNGKVVIGGLAGLNMVMDGNEIMARDNNGVANLVLQNKGGAVMVGGRVVHSSDRRLKKDIKDLPYGLTEVLKLQPVHYNWKHRQDDKVHLGLIAQEVQKIIPEIVNQSQEDGMLSLGYTELVPVLINAVQQQQEIIKNQSQKITQLEKRQAAHTDLQAQLDQLKSQLEKISRQQSRLTSNK